ncbi:MAG: DNA-directed RNA polymerase subunit beta', partial [Candidatus Gracilibacteria bacterium]|nr:DNA-directed RNA polymerase subunit beta' [Candidatus Gracilibacteria bacterium]
MVSSKNMLNPSNGEPIIAPSQDMILGCYYLTRMDTGESKLFFTGREDAEIAYEQGAIKFGTPIKVRMDGKIVDTTYGRMIFNTIVPEELGFVNETLSKGNLKKLLSRAFDVFGSEETAFLSDRIKNIGYKYATLSGITISKDDIIIPLEKPALIKDGDEKVKYIQKKFWHGYLTEKERYEQSIKVRSNVKKLIEKEMKKYFEVSNNIFSMIDSGARGNWGNVTQLCGMKGLVASPTGKIIELPIKSNLKEGFSTLEYFNATHGGRKGKADTALKTAQSGYLTRRLIDATQNIIVAEEDCGTIHHEEIKRKLVNETFNVSFEERIFGKVIAVDLVKGGKILARAGDMITKDVILAINENEIDSINVKSILTCETESGVCQKCYGLDLATSRVVKIGTPVGIVAAQSIGEPGTQLTMRTFHSGGVAKEGGDITQGLSRVEELFEARKPKGEALIAEVDGVVQSIKYMEKELVITIKANSLETKEHYIPEDDYKILVKKGDKVNEKQNLAKSAKGKVLCEKTGIVKKIENNIIYVEDEQERVIEHKCEMGRNIITKEGEKVEAGDRITEGNVDTSRLIQLGGVLKTEDYIISNIKSIYSSQGQTVNAKHIEVIVRQMFSKVKVLNSGDSSFFPGDIVDIIAYQKENDRLTKEGLKQAIGTRLLLGITKISLFTESWLSASSFQETVRVLVEASTAKKIDKLKGLKENVIIGRLIPTGRYYKNNIQTGDYFDQDKEDVEEVMKEKGLEKDESMADYAVLN